LLGWPDCPPANTQWQRNLLAGNDYNEIGGVLVAQEAGPAALAAYQADLTIAKGLAKRDPANRTWPGGCGGVALQAGH
jgi:hypothetical protein